MMTSARGGGVAWTHRKRLATLPALIVLHLCNLQYCMKHFIDILKIAAAILLAQLLWNFVDLLIQMAQHVHEYNSLS